MIAPIWLIGCWLDILVNNDILLPMSLSTVLQRGVKNDCCSSHMGGIIFVLLLGIVDGLVRESSQI